MFYADKKKMHDEKMKRILASLFGNKTKETGLEDKQESLEEREKGHSLMDHMIGHDREEASPVEGSPEEEASETPEEESSESDDMQAHEAHDGTEMHHEMNDEEDKKHGRLFGKKPGLHVLIAMGKGK